MFYDILSIEVGVNIEGSLKYCYEEDKIVFIKLSLSDESSLLIFFDDSNDLLFVNK